jgi:HSP20 family molecular chaperone IbpA
VRYGHFERSVKVPEGFKGDQIIATCDKGILRLEMPMPKSADTRKIPVQVAATPEKKTEP